MDYSWRYSFACERTRGASFVLMVECVTECFITFVYSLEGLYNLHVLQSISCIFYIFFIALIFTVWYRHDLASWSTWNSSFMALFNLLCRMWSNFYCSQLGCGNRLVKVLCVWLTDHEMELQPPSEFQVQAGSIRLKRDIMKDIY